MRLWLPLIIVFLACVFDMSEAQAVFQPEEASPGAYNQLMDDKEKQAREAKYLALKKEEAQAEAIRRQEARSHVSEFFGKLGTEVEAGANWKNINRWLMNISFIGIFAALAWYGWKYNQGRDRG